MAPMRCGALQRGPHTRSLCTNERCSDGFWVMGRPHPHQYQHLSRTRTQTPGGGKRIALQRAYLPLTSA